MKLIAIMPARNEEWCLGLSARAALMWADEVIVLDHASSDRTPEILSEIHERLSWFHVSDEDWLEMSHRQRLLECARARGATHIAIVDADEVLTGNLLSTIRETINIQTMHGFIVNVPWLCLPRGIDRVVTGASYWGERQNVCIAFKDREDFHWSSAGRGGYDFHHRPPMATGDRSFVNALRPESGGLMHLQFLSYERLRAKQALYQMTEVLRWPGRTKPSELAAMYGRAVLESEPSACQTRAVPAEWWDPYRPLLKYLHVDAEPWQKKEVARLIAEHGREKFAGLNLFGL